MECVREWQTLPLFFKTDLPTDNETITRKQQEESDNGSGTSDSIPEQPNEPIQETPQLNF